MKKIVLLAGDGASTRIIYHYLSKYFDIQYVIIEKGVNKKTQLKRRIKKLGLWTVIGQVLFRCIVVPFLEKTSKKRIQQIKAAFQLNDSPIPAEKVKKVTSVNAKETMDILSSQKPDLIIVNGTRIISKQVLALNNATFINTHAGITPKYRGVHGMYWALATNDRENAGVTVHFVDAGIDTGKIIKQSRVSFTPKDNFVTYPLLQLAQGVKLLQQSIDDFFKGTLTETQNQLESKLWYHPTIWQYIYNRLVKKTK